MSTNKTIAKNTLFLYIRMFLTMGVSLYTSRVILNVLGVEDFGIYTLVGGVVALFGFFNAAMSSATQRFLAIDIGKKDWNNLHKTFNSTLVVHVGIAAVVLLVSETLGLWFVNYKLNVPDGKIADVNFVYQFSVIASIIAITQVPFNALIIVRERMNVFAVISILEVVLKLLIVYLLYISPFNKLKTYALLMLLVTIIVSTIYKIYCQKQFKESKFSYHNDKGAYKVLISYSGWNLFGNIAAIAKEQGINVMLNIFFGTLLNAAFGITMQVQTAVNSFVINFQTAINPQIYKTYAQKDFVQMQRYMFQSAKFSFFMLLILICPIIYNIDFILIFWLKKPPSYTSTFITLTLINITIESISRPLITGALATGKIKIYQIVVGSVLFLNLPITYLFFKLGLLEMSFLYVAISLSIVALVFRLFFLKSMINLNIATFFSEVLMPIILVSIASMFSLFAYNYFIGRPETFLGVMFNGFSTVATISLFIYLFGLRKIEKEMIKSFINKKKS